MDICTGCGECPIGGPFVGSRGDPKSPIVVVGEAPGSQEISKSTPFIGPSGKLLDAALVRAGLDGGLRSCFATNAMQCRPKESPPANATIQACQSRLHDELSLAPRKLIIALGNSAMKSVLNNMHAKISSERGRVFDTPYGPVVPVYHPAAILRQSHLYGHMMTDLRKAVSLYLDGTRLDPGKTAYGVVTEATLDTVLKLLARRPVLSCDIETTGFDPLSDRVLSIGIAYAKNKVFIFPIELVRAYIDRMRALFATPGIRWVWHNGKFDTKFLRRLGIDAPLGDDTMLKHYCLDEIKGTHDLKQLSQVYLGAKRYAEELKPWLKSKATSFEVIPRPVLYQYQAKDCDYTYQLDGLLDAELERPTNAGLPILYRQTLMPGARFLRGVEETGIMVDPDELAKQRLNITRARDKAIQETLAAASPFWNGELYASDMGTMTVPLELNLASPRQLHWLLYRRLKLRPKRGYALNTREDTLENLEVPHSIVAGILEFRGHAKMLSTYIEGIAKRISVDGKIHTTFNIHGTVTGRLSSSNPNMQNIPRASAIKNLFVASAGFSFVEMDYSQAELRVLAELSRDEFLMEVYLTDRDLHDEVSLALYGPGFTKDQRVRAKAVNFGIPYGRGEDSIAKEYDMPREEAKELIEAWYHRAPGAYTYIMKCRQAPVLRKTLTTPFHRRRRFHMASRENLYALQNEAANFPISSTASDITLHTAMALQEVFQSRWSLDKVRVVNIVHDSILAEVHDSVDRLEVKALMIQVAESRPAELIGAVVPFKADVKMGHSWGSMYD